MRPTKVHRARKRDTRRKEWGDPILNKLMQLKYRINDTAKTENGFSVDMGSDKEWVMGEITNLRGGGWLSATKMKVANEMWGKYGG
jgi:hypothetical protein